MVRRNVLTIILVIVVFVSLWLVPGDLAMADEIGGRIYSGSDLGLGGNYSFFRDTGQAVHTWIGVNDWSSESITRLGGAVLRIASGSTANLIATASEVDISNSGDILLNGTLNHNSNTSFDISGSNSQVLNFVIENGGKYVFNTVGDAVGTLRFNQDVYYGRGALQLNAGGVIEVNDTSATDNAVIERGHSGSIGVFALNGGTINVNNGQLDVIGGGPGVFFRASSGEINVAAGAGLNIAQAEFVSGGVVGGRIDGTFIVDVITTSPAAGGVTGGSVLNFQGNGIEFTGEGFWPAKTTSNVTNKGIITYSGTDSDLDNSHIDVSLTNVDGGTFIHKSASTFSSSGIEINLSDTLGSGGTYEFQDAGVVEAAQVTVFDGGMVRKTGPETAAFSESRGSSFFSIRSGGGVEVTGGRLNIWSDRMRFNGAQNLTPYGNLGFSVRVDDEAHLDIDTDGNGSKSMGDPIALVSISPGATLDIRGSGQFTNATRDLLGAMKTVGGVLLVSDRVLTPGGGTLTIAQGGELGGRGGTIDGAVVCQAGATLAPGLSVGRLTVGDLTVDAGGVNYEWEIAAGYDQVNVAGALTLGAGPHVLKILNGSGSDFLPADKFNLLTWSGGADPNPAPWTVEAVEQDDVRWTGGNAPDCDWETPANWDHVAYAADISYKELNGSPLGSDAASAGGYIELTNVRASFVQGPLARHNVFIADGSDAGFGGPAAVIGPETATTMNSLTIGNGAANSVDDTLDLGSGGLTITDALTIRGDGALIADVAGATVGGALTLDGELAVGPGITVSFAGGTISPGATLTLDGELNIASGQLESEANLTVRSGPTSRATHWKSPGEA
jgi:hypothetical protein